MNYGDDYGLFGMDYEISSHVTYTLSQDGTRLSALEYSAANPNGVSRGELTLPAPSLTVYGGSGNAAAAGISRFVSLASFSNVRYSYEGTGDTAYGPSETAPTNAGSYRVSMTVTAGDGKDYTLRRGYTIAKANFVIPVTGLPRIFDYANETVTVDTGTGTAEPVIILCPQQADNKNAYDPNVELQNGASISDYTGMRMFYIVAVSDNYNASRTWHYFDVPARPAAPSGLAGTDESYDGFNDGKITGADETMEYSADNGTTWTAVSGTEITGLADGSYLVRLKAVAGQRFAGWSTSVMIEKGVEPTYTLNAEDVGFDREAYDPVGSYEAKTLTITSSGNSDATITNVICTGPFEVAVIGNRTVTAGGTDRSWAVRPKTGIGVSEAVHPGIVTIEYNNGAVATAVLSVTIFPAEQEAPEHPTLQYPWGTDWIAYEKDESDAGSPIQYSFNGGQTWLTGDPDPENENRLIISGLTPDAHYSVDFRYGPSPDGNYAASEKYVGSTVYGFTTLHEVKLLEGNGQTFYLGSESGLTFVTSDRREDFEYLWVYPAGQDGPGDVGVLDPSFYMAEEGRVCITLKAAYLNTLPVGEYTLEIPCLSRLGDHPAVKVSFRVEEAPKPPVDEQPGGDIVKTGDERMAGL